MSSLPTGTVTFLFTDIEGSTRLWEQHPDAMPTALARHDDLLRRSIEQQGGYVFKTVGDAFCAAFPNANSALEAALVAQVALAAEPWGLPAPLLVRMAFHTGATEERGGDYFGQSLNRVARLMEAGYGGQVLLSEVTQGLVRDALPLNATLRDLSQHRLKDLGRPEQVFQLLYPALPADFPPLRSLDNPDLPNNLPQQATSFIGREKQVEEVKARLGKTRLLTLTGAGGSGKTRLSLQVAADLLTGEGDGVWLVELATLSDPALVPGAVAQALGVREEAGKPIQQTLVESLRAKRLLLVLDNCEHLVSACASLASDLLRSCPGVHLLASSREPLNVAGEQTYRVPSLSLPDPKQAQTVEGLSQFEAVRLFIERAQAVQPSFSVTDANAPAVSQVCFHLDGIPLAIELAAARVRAMPVEQINARLGQRFRLLTGGARNALPRQQTLRALIDWSYDLLNEKERALLGRLSVFAGGWALEAPESVCTGEPVEDWEVLDLLTSLVDKSLVVYEERGDGEGRYRLQETVRQYGAERLEEAGEAEEVRARHRDHFLALAEGLPGKLGGPEQGVWLDRLEAEHDNLRAALEVCQEDPEAAQGGLRLAAALYQFWEVRGHWREGRERLTALLALPAGQERTRARADALNGAARLASSQGDFAASQSLDEQSLALRRDLGDTPGVACSLMGLGKGAWQAGDLSAARSLHEQSLALYRQLGDKRGVSTSLSHLAFVTAAQGYDEAARALHEQSLALQREIGNKGGVAYSLAGLGALAAAGGDPAAARDLYEQSLALRRELGDKWGVAASLNDLGGILNQAGDFSGARACLAESLTLCRQAGDRWQSAIDLEGSADLEQRQGRPRRAARLYGAAQALREAIGSPLPPSERGVLDGRLAELESSLGPDAFAAAINEGRALAWEQAVDYALSEGEAPA